MATQRLYNYCIENISRFEFSKYKRINERDFDALKLAITRKRQWIKISSLYIFEFKIS
jgi:hypothetical protein